MPEKQVAVALRRLGLTYRKHVATLPGSVDFANRRRRWGVFVHGCFWPHHKGCKRATTPKTSQEYWIPKLISNQHRDIINQAVLRKLGFFVIVIWECQVKDTNYLRNALQPLAGLNNT